MLSNHVELVRNLAVWILFVAFPAYRLGFLGCNLGWPFSKARSAYQRKMRFRE